VELNLKINNESETKMKATPNVIFKVRVPSDDAEPNSCEIFPSTWGDLTTNEIFSKL